LNAFRGGADNIDNEVGVRQHRDVTAVDRVDGCTHTLRDEALQIRVNRAIALWEPCRRTIGFDADRQAGTVGALPVAL
jgi:hypothetical protein